MADLCPALVDGDDDGFVPWHGIGGCKLEIPDASLVGNAALCKVAGSVSWAKIRSSAVRFAVIELSPGMQSSVSIN